MGVFLKLKIHKMVPGIFFRVDSLFRVNISQFNALALLWFNSWVNGLFLLISDSQFHVFLLSQFN